ncbi:efflux RND transporter periplasmic adaptor subunit [uncultured Paracoccus sp.]|uniref:efflux RND transporter periplasmic adaptor subunit n=1 Tax=uncultured Paracoccus sp. TaxID=189685 RepID=UPI0025F3D0D6|nr:efflux RND transporter periplasmic adaptor subunit [uncultured Paracoccus sp.]
MPVKSPLLLTAFLLAATLVPPVATRALEAAGQVLPAVQVSEAANREMQRRVPVSGSLAARQEVVIHPKVNGYAVTELLADSGDRVEAGQVLARLQDQTLRAQLAQAEAEHERASAGIKQAESQIASAAAALTEASATLERTRRLRASGSTAQAALDQAVAAQATAQANADSARDGLSVARAALAQADAARVIARLNLDYARITSPIGGVVIERNVNLGELSGSATLPMFRVIADGEVELAAEVIESAIPELRIGAPVTLEVSGIGRLEGRIRLLPAAVDPATRLGTMRVALDPDERLRPGLFASGWIVTQSVEAVAVPTSAVLTGEGGDYVQVVRDGQVETRPVRAGLIWDGHRQITEGLAEGETVLTRAGAFFRTGDRVQVIAPGEGEAAP